MTENRKSTHRVTDIFTCTMCGYCCQGNTTVSLDEDDRRRMVAALDLPENEVRERYWRVSGKIVQMKTVDGHCVFYLEGKGCSVHNGRPWRCGQWPLHPSILADPGNLQAIRESCPGLNSSLSYEEFCAILRELLRQQDRIMF